MQYNKSLTSIKLRPQHVASGHVLEQYYLTRARLCQETDWGTGAENYAEGVVGLDHVNDIFVVKHAPGFLFTVFSGFRTVATSIALACFGCCEPEVLEINPALNSESSRLVAEFEAFVYTEAAVGNGVSDSGETTRRELGESSKLLDSAVHGLVQSIDNFYLPDGTERPDLGEEDIVRLDGLKAEEVQVKRVVEDVEQRLRQEAVDASRKAMKVDTRGWNRRRRRRHRRVGLFAIVVWAKTIFRPEVQPSESVYLTVRSRINKQMLEVGWRDHDRHRDLDTAVSMTLCPMNTDLRAAALRHTIPFIVNMESYLRLCPRSKDC